MYPDALTPTPPPPSYIVRTKKADVARVEKRTFLCTARKEDAVTEPKAGCKSKLGNWKDEHEMDSDFTAKYRGCMKGEALCAYTRACCTIFI